MNEQLIVKNFGPIKDATVNFKKVTVFIGPTGGGKSTLAKLAAIFRDSMNLIEMSEAVANTLGINLRLKYFKLNKYKQSECKVQWLDNYDHFVFEEEKFTHVTSIDKNKIQLGRDLVYQYILNHPHPLNNSRKIISGVNETEKDYIYQYYKRHTEVFYIPSERSFVAFIEKGKTNLLSGNVSLPPYMRKFIKQYDHCRYSVKGFPLPIPFFNSVYKSEISDSPLINLPDNIDIPLSESASGMQAIIPMMLIIKYNVERDSLGYNPKSFVVEEPELNLYPTAQQGLLNWLTEKCTTDQNDLTITTHSPYILSHLNLLLYAYQVAEKHPDRADDVAKIVPRESWINPKEFAAYHVEGQKEGGVHSIVNPETGLISYNGLDALASSSANEFDQLLDINAGLEVE